MWQQASDWTLRRLLKALLKRHLKHVLATELDVEQLRVSLGRGTLELRDVLISPEWLAGHVPPGLEVVSGYVGRLALELVVSSLTCALQLEDVLVTVRPSAGSNTSTAAELDPAAQQAAEVQEGIDGGAGATGFGMDDGLRLVAAGVETLLQRMTVTLNQLSIRAEAAAGGCAAAASLSCTQLSYGAASPGTNQKQQQDCQAVSTTRRVCFRSLCLMAEEGGLPVLAPLGGEVDVTVNWPLDPLPGQRPHVLLAVSLEAAQLQLRPPDVVALLELARGFTTSAATLGQQRHQQQQQQLLAVLPNSERLAGLVPWQQVVYQPPQRPPQPSSASFIEDLMLPGCERSVQEALLESEASSTGQEEVDEFFDAKSLLGSLQQAFTSAMATSFPSAATIPGATSSAFGGGGGDLGLGSDIFALHDLAASIRQEGAVQGKQWSFSLSVPSFTLSLLYPEAEPAGCSSRPLYAPRLVTELLDLTMAAHAESVAYGESIRGWSGSSAWSLTVGALEVAEHLPFPSPSPACSGTTAASCSTWVPAEEMARVPAVLPCAQHVQWATPTFAGDYPVPDEAGTNLGIGDTLAQLSGLSQATVYQSVVATPMENSRLQQSIVCQDVAALPRVQIVPVLRCGSEAGTALVLHRSNSPPAPNAAQKDAPGTDVALMLEPVSIWCTLPLIVHLQSFVAAVAQLPGRAADVVATSSESAISGSSKSAVAAAISAILEEQEQQQPPLQQGPRSASATQEPERAALNPLRLSVYLPAACIIVAIPGAVMAGSLPQPLPKYFALHVQSSSYQLLASACSRLGSQQPKALLASLRESGVEPTVVLQQGSGGYNTLPLETTVAMPRAWTCAVHIGAATVHAVAEAAMQLQPGDSLLGPALFAVQVASIEGAPVPEQWCLGIDACWRQPHAQRPCSLLDNLWASAEPGCQPPDQGDLQGQLTASAHLLVTINSRVPLVLKVEHGLLIAASSLADGLLQLSAAPLPVDAATQAVLVLDCEVQCTLVPPHGPPFSIAARSVSAVACSSIASVAGSSTVAVTIGAIDLTRHEQPGHECVLLHAGGQQQVDERHTPAVQFLALLRPIRNACQLCSNGRYVLPFRGRISVCTSGLTVQLDERGQLAWLANLQGLSARGAIPASSDRDPGMGSAAAATSRDSGAGLLLPPPPAPTLEWAVSLSGTTVRYEPCNTSQAAAVLTVASIAWQSRQDQQASLIQARRLALNVAAAAGSSSSRVCISGKACNDSLAVSASSCPSLAADVAGFHQVAAESSITVRLPAAAQPVVDKGPQTGQHAAAVPEIIISNTGLGITLSRHTLLLLRRLMGQLTTSDGGGTGANGISGGLGPLACSSTTACVGNLGSCESGQQTSAVNVMQGVLQSAYATPPRPVEHPAEAAVFLDGGWYDPEQAGTDCAYVMSPAGSPPTMVEDFMEGFATGRSTAAQEEQGVWYDAGMGLDVLEEYVALQPHGEDEVAASFGSPDYDCRILPPSYPIPERRISLQDISVIVTLADTFATVLLPEENNDDEMEVLGSGLPVGSAQQHRPNQALGTTTTATTTGLAGSGDEEEVVPLNAQVQARLEGVCLQLDSFAEQQKAGDAPAPRLRCALVVRTLEVRDSFQPRRGGNSASATVAAATGWSDLRRMLGYHASVHRMRGPKSCMVQAVVEAIHTEPGAELEYRVQTQLLPLLLHLDQAALAFLHHFFAPAHEESGVSDATAEAAQVVAQTAMTGDLFFQRCEVHPFTLTINYRPHRVDLAALSSGQLSEVLNLVPWGGVNLQFRHLRLFGMQGLSGIGTAVASAYVEDIARFQAHRFVGGIAPIKSICRVSAAAAQLLAIPQQQLYQHSRGGGSGSLSLTALVDEDFWRQMQRGLAGFVRAVALEALNLGATVAAGAEIALAGESSASHTAGVKEALRQASAHLRSSTMGPISAATAAATAMRTALLGVRNTLDKEHTMERRLNS